MGTVRLRALCSLGAVIAGLLAVVAPARAAAPGLAVRGRVIVTRDCARCHAVAAVGESPLPAAPPFRRLHERYDVEALAESLAEGLTVGHGPMPEWRFAPSDIDAIVAYLKSLQAAPPPACRKCVRSSPP